MQLVPPCHARVLKQKAAMLNTVECRTQLFDFMNNLQLPTAFKLLIVLSEQILR